MPDIYIVSGTISDLIFLYLGGLALIGLVWGLISGVAQGIREWKKK